MEGYLPPWKNTQGRNSSSSYDGLCWAWVGSQLTFTMSLKSVQFQAPMLRMICWTLGGVAGLHPLGSPPPPPRVSTCPVLCDCKYLSCSRAEEKWLEPGAAGLSDTGWSGRRVSFSYLLRIRISSWPLRAKRKPLLSATRVHWVYIFIPLRTELGYTFFLR